MSAAPGTTNSAAASARLAQARLAHAATLLQQGDPRAAIAQCEALIEMAPDTAQAWELLGVAAAAVGDNAKAIDAFRRTIELRPDHAPALLNLGAMLAGGGDAWRAIDCFRRARAAAPENRTAPLFLARALVQAGEADAAAAEAEAALGTQPDNAPLWTVLAQARLARNETDAAIEALQRGAAIEPAEIGALLLLARLLHRGLRFEAAYAIVERALAIQPVPSAVYALAAEIEIERRQVGTAMRHARSAVDADPNLPDAHRALGLALLATNDLAAAASAFDAALRLAPKRADLAAALGDIESRRGNPAGAIDAFRKALTIEPEQRDALTRLYVVLRDTCRWDEAAALRPTIDRLVDRALAEGTCPPETPFVDLTIHEDMARNLAVARGWAEMVVRRSDGLKRPAVAARPAADERLRIGYLSDDLRDHAVGHQLAGLFDRHDRRSFAVHLYSYSREDGSDWRRRAIDGAESCVDIAALDDATAAQRIADDGISILVDLKGFTRQARLGIAALRPAPVQATWLGFPGSCGGAFFDYMLSDRIVTPPTAQTWFAERLCCLPNTYQVNDDRLDIPTSAMTRAEAGLPESDFVFCCFNKPFKIDAPLFDLWLSILDAVPRSVLWLWSRNALAEAAMRERAATRGIDPKRLLFAGKVVLPRHLQRLHLADLALDSMPYNGHATTSNALWAGVPVVTVLGGHFASRVSASLLTAADIPELIAADRDTYRARAIELAHDPATLGVLRAKLAAARHTAPFFDTGRFVRNLECAYEAMWARHRRGELPATIEIGEPS
ncbi:MAG: tetratricopeptide repeat protein [Dongiaceae bacterium]